MYEVKSLSSPQLVIREQSGVVVDLSTKQIVSLYKKSEQSNIPFDALKEVYQRGYSESMSEQVAFNRVNSFIAGGAAAEIDKDILEKIKEPTGDLKSACWKGYTAVGMKMKNGRKVPNCVPKEEYTGAEKVSKNSDDASSRFMGTDSLTNVYKKATPGYTNTIKRVVKEQLEEDSKGYKNPNGGLTQKGRDHYNRETGSHLKAPVTTPPSELKAGSKSANRRKSFCARMGGMEGPMKKPNGEPTRKALALRKWNCEETQVNELTVRDAAGKLIPIKKVVSRGSDMKLHKTYPGKSSSSGGGGSGGSGSGGSGGD